MSVVPRGEPTDPITHDRATAVAWVTEDTGSAPFPEDGFTDEIAAARFTARIHVEHPEMQYFQGPEWVEIDEALAWARPLAAEVIVRTCEGREGKHYSAGEVPSQWLPSMPEWPDEGVGLVPRRMAEWEFLDRTAADPPIEWRGVIGGEVRPQPEGFGAAFEQALHADRSVRVLDTKVNPLPGPPPAALDAMARGEKTGWTVIGGTTVQAMFAVDCDTHAGAVEAMTAACAAATERALAESPPPPHQQHIAEWSANVAPTESRFAARLSLREREPGEIG